MGSEMCIRDRSDGILVHRERYIAVARIVVFYIGNQIRCVLPYQFCFSRRAVSVVAYIGGSDRVTSMVDERTQNSGSGRSRRGICGRIGRTTFDGISIY